jgi:hypothetical protein
MKKSKLNLVFLLIGIICFPSCKKKDNPKEDEPVVPVIATSPPPASGDYWLVRKNVTHIYWTQDFEIYHELSADIDGQFIFLSGDTVLITGFYDGFLKYGNVSNPAGFRKIPFSKAVYSVGYTQGYIVALADEANNKYVGLCNIKKGETELKFTPLASGESFSGLYKINNSLVSNVSTNLGTSMTITSLKNDSIRWNPAPSPAQNMSFQYFDGGNGVTVAYNGNLCKTTSPSLLSASWSYQNIFNTNTSDSSGSFTPFEVNDGGFLNIDGKWKIYGMIEMTANGHKIPAVNISSDNGASWQTTLLNGIPYSKTIGDVFKYKCFASKKATFVMFANGGVDLAYVYKSSDGINFTKLLESYEAQNLFMDTWTAVYVK